jgi:hypothetical protein
MFEPNKLNVGDVFYGIRKKLCAMHRHKEYKIIDGVEWFKYSDPVFTYSVTYNTVVAILRKTIEAKDPDYFWPHQFDLEPEFCIVTCQASRPDALSEPMTFNSNDEYFHTTDKVNSRIAELKNEAKELDRT